MYQLKGFMKFLGYSNNTPWVNNKIGELSTLSLTYAKEKGFYSSSINTNLELISFSSKTDNALVAVPTDVQSNVFTIVSWLFNQMNSGGLTSDKTNLLNALISSFGTQIEQIVAGSIVTENGKSIPEWLSWKIKGTDNNIRIWFSDDAFQAQYDEFEIVVVPALNPVDNFYLDSNVVKTKLNAVTMSIMNDNMQQARSTFPETLSRIESYDYIAPNNSTFKVASHWGVIIYGAAGNNNDNIKSAIIEYVLSRSSHSRAEWIVILPDLFRRTEFIFTPFWDTYAIPNRVLEAGVYTPVMRAANLFARAKLTAPEYPDLHINTYLTIFDHPHRCLGMTCIGSPENRDNKFLITDWFADYLNVNTTNLDFNRMSEATKTFATTLATLVYYAETLTKYSVLPFSYSKVIRNEKLFVAKSINNVQYLVAAKINFVELPYDDSVVIVDDVETNIPVITEIFNNVFYSTLPWASSTLTANVSGSAAIGSDGSYGSNASASSEVLREDFNINGISTSTSGLSLRYIGPGNMPNRNTIVDGLVYKNLKNYGILESQNLFIDQRGTEFLFKFIDATYTDGSKANVKVLVNQSEDFSNLNSGTLVNHTDPDSAKVFTGVLTETTKLGIRVTEPNKVVTEIRLVFIYKKLDGTWANFPVIWGGTD